ncbi:hypothetical protein B0T26DRAFT_805874 [Lasiosphaeria miniovina]|uniref:C2H2-type domain-containing protein n=1 Tax=Lasiosphaeria miniovina TaxID=1954250 RepID=A0AA39ZYJ1_9PEZI|nr:uncharacterized protein B0T26DRAFT_805874 [Lasiosphaeria miniovina]KAK0705959.1 hypothetical protein B0T26DRAFT_805874 [Lasiosphaeria miniovina]
MGFSNFFVMLRAKSRSSNRLQKKEHLSLALSSNACNALKETIAVVGTQGSQLKNSPASQWTLTVPPTIPIASAAGCAGSAETALALLHHSSGNAPHVQVFSDGKVVAIWILQAAGVSGLSLPGGYQLPRAPGRAPGRPQALPAAAAAKATGARSRKAAKTRKRKARHPGEPQDDKDSDDSDREPDDPQDPEGPEDAADEPRRGRNFACPFYKLNPHEYADCCRKKLNTISRVMQHFRRCHAMPAETRGYFHYCARCFTQFRDDEESIWREHCVACVTVEPAPDDLFNNELEELHRLFETNSRLPPPRRWYELWDQAFGVFGHARPSSPYVEHGVAEVIGLIRSQGVARLAAQIDTVLQNHCVLPGLAPMFRRFAQDVVDIILTPPALVTRRTTRPAAAAGQAPPRLPSPATAFVDRPEGSEQLQDARLYDDRLHDIVSYGDELPIDPALDDAVLGLQGHPDGAGAHLDNSGEASGPSSAP